VVRPVTTSGGRHEPHEGGHPSRAADVDGDGDGDGDGDEEVLLYENLGGASERVQAWGVRGCDWVSVSVNDASPMAFSLVADDMHRTATVCSYGDRARLTTYSATRQRGSDWTVHAFPFVWSDLRLTPAGDETESVVPASAVDQVVPPGFNCSRPTGAVEPEVVPICHIGEDMPLVETPPAPKAVKATPHFTG
jgi:hypothetical protein